MAGWLPLFASRFNQAKRSTINMTGPNAFSYAFIDHMKQADGAWGPGGIDYYLTANPEFTTVVDDDGWINDAAGQNLRMGGGPRIPGTNQFSGPYVITWTGDGTVELQGHTHVFTANTTSSAGDTTATYTRVGNAFTNASGQTARVILDITGYNGPCLLNLKMYPTGTSNFPKNCQFYRLEDEADLLAGKIFRTGFKQMIIDYNPYAVRMLDWSATNDSLIARWEHRLLPTDASWFFNHGASHQPKYSGTSTTPTNTLVLDSGGVPDMPVAMQHGELVTFRLNADFVRSNGAKAVTGITRNNTATNTVTCPGHGFANGDTIQIQMHSQTPGSNPEGMTQLHDVPCVISNVATDTFDISVNTSSYSAFTVGNAYQYITLNVGNRGAYPIVGYDGVSKAGRFGSGNWLAGLPSIYRAFMFHKEIQASSTVTGAWLYPLSFYEGHCGLPIEVMVKFMNELMEMGPKNPIHLYYNLPHFGLISDDPDYNSASNFPVNAVDCILNPSSTVRTPGWDELDSRCNLYLEHGNETWNFSMGYMFGRLGWQDWGEFSLAKYGAVRAAKTFNEIRAVFPADPRLKTIIGMWSTLGPDGFANEKRIISDADQQAAMGSAADMMTYFDYACIAFYAENNNVDSTYSLSTAVTNFIAAGTNSSTIDSIMATYAQGWAEPAKGGNETINRYITLLADYAAATADYGKGVIGYEGGIQFASLSRNRVEGTFSGTSVSSISGPNLASPTITVGWYIIGEGIPDYTWVTASGAGSATVNQSVAAGVKFFTYMSPTDAFLMYFKRSQAWADTYLTWFNAWNSVSNAIAPPEFLLTDAGGDRWNHDLDDAYEGGVEGAALDLAWQAQAARNNS